MHFLYSAGFNWRWYCRQDDKRSRSCVHVNDYLEESAPGVTLPGSWPTLAPMHWVMAPPDMAPIEEDMYGPGDIEPPIPWCGEFRDCIGGLERQGYTSFQMAGGRQDVGENKNNRLYIE